MASVDLNADLGEGFGTWQLGDDDAMLGLVTSANVACGFHAGDPTTLRHSCEEAAKQSVRIGAQVGYRDLAGFGRRFIDVTQADLTADVIYQIGALQALAHAAGSSVSYVKPHGALYNTIVTNHDQARAVAEAVHAVDPNLPVLGLAGSVFFAEAERPRPSHGARGVRRPRRTGPTGSWSRGGNATPCCTTRQRSPTGWRRWCSPGGSSPLTDRPSPSPSNPCAYTVIRRAPCRSPRRCGTGWRATASNWQAFV